MTRTQATKLFKSISLVGIYGGLLMPLVFIPQVIFPFVFSKIIAFQILVGLTFPAYIALAWMEKEYRPKKHIVYLGILAYFAAIALSVVFAIDPYRAWWGNQERMNGLFSLLHFLAWLTVAVGVLKEWKDWKRLLNYEIVLSGIMALVAIIQKFHPTLLMFSAGRRVGGLLDNPIYMAAYQIFNLFFLALLAWKVKNRRWWWLYGGVALLDIFAFVFTESRGGLLGLALGIVAFTFFMGLFHKSKKVKVGILSGLAVLVVAYSLVFAFRNTELIAHSPLRRFTDFSDTVDTRLIAWNIAWEGFLEKPITGWGFDNFHILFNQKYNPQSLRFGQYETWFDRAHNTVLDVLSMTGSVGFLAYAFMFISIFYSVIRAYKKEWIDLPIAAILFSLPIAYFFQNLLVFDHPAGFSMSFLLYALVISATSAGFMGGQDKEDHKEEKTIAHSAPWLVFGILQAIALLIVWRASVIPFEVSKMSIDANNLITKDFDAALDLAKQASLQWTPYSDEQSFIMSRNLVTLASQRGFSNLDRWREAYDFTKELDAHDMALHPNNTNTLFVYARLLHAFGSLVPEDIPQAEQLYLDAIATSPKRQQLQYALARLYLETGKQDAAIDILKTVKDYDYELGEGHWRYGVALFYDKSSLQDGANEIALSQSVSYPFHLTSGREFIPLVDAYLVSSNQAALDELLTQLDAVSLDAEGVYAQIAAKLTIMGMDSEKQTVIDFAQQSYPDIVSSTEAIVKSYEAQRGATTSAQ